MRRLFTTAEFLSGGRTEKELRWGVKTGKWVRAAHGVYADGPEPVDALRPAGAAATESLLETLAIQMVRATPGVPEPVRQFWVYDEHGVFVARVDVAWPDVGVFYELDGEGHKDQPIYDAARESAVVAATGWLCNRSSWTEVRHNPIATGRKLARVIEQARNRPLVAKQ